MMNGEDLEGSYRDQVEVISFVNRTNLVHKFS